MERLLAPEALKDGNLSEGWRRFKREFEQFLEAIEKTEADDKVKVSILLRVIGERINDIYLYKKRCLTKFEKRGISLGHKITELSYKVK